MRTDPSVSVGPISLDPPPAAHPKSNDQSSMPSPSEPRRIVGESHPNSNINEKYPFLKLGEKPKVMMTSEEVVRGLRRVTGEDGEVHGQGSTGYLVSATIFNGAIQSAALAVVRPTDASHVSATVKFCREHGLDISVKAGGSGVHGQSIAGNVIIDMINMNKISISLPSSEISLEESFDKLHISRPGFTQKSSSSSTVKRSATDDSEAGPGDAQDSAQVKRRDLDDIREDTDSPTNRSASASSSDASQAAISGYTRSPIEEGDSLRGSGSWNSQSADITRAVNRAFSQTPSRDGSHSSGSASTGGSGQGSSDGNRSSSGSGSSGLRTTYVNPSPTTATSFPFVSTPYGPVSSYSNYSSPPIHDASAAPYTIVTFGAGVHSKQLDAETGHSPYGPYHTPTSAFPVGAGQFLSGGFGFIGRQHGLAMDALIEAEVVLADGRIVWVSKDKAGGEWKEGEDPNELWWGLRGAGAALGVVTRFRAKAHYIPSVFAGNFIYIFDQTTPSLLRHVRDCVKGSPRALYANFILTAGPPGAPAIVVIQLCYSGRRSEGEQYVQSIASWEGGRCLFQDFSERSFEMQQVAVEEVLKGGFGKKWYIKSDMLKSLTDDVIDQTCHRFNAIPDGCTWLFEYTGGGYASEVTDSCFPQEHRQGQFTVAALHQWAHDEPPALDTRCVTTAEEWINEVIRPHSIGGPLPCFLQSARTEDVKAVYGPSYDRLVALKRQLDPTDLFKHAMFTRSDGSEGPDEWKQLPPLTEERVRIRNMERAKAKEERLSRTGNEDGMQVDGVEGDDAEADQGKVRGFKMQQDQSCHKDKGKGRSEVGSDKGSFMYRPDGKPTDSDTDLVDEATTGTAPAADRSQNGATMPVVQVQHVADQLVTNLNRGQDEQGQRQQRVDDPSPPSTSATEAEAEAGRQEQAQMQSVRQHQANVPLSGRDAAGVVDPVTGGESMVG